MLTIMRAACFPPEGPPPAESAGEPLPESLTRYTGFLVAKAHQRLFALFGSACRKLGLEVPHPGILHVLEEGGPMSQRLLGRKLRVDRSSMVKLVDALEEGGFARRRSHPRDRRVHLVEVTPAGRRVLAAITRLADQMEARLLARFTAAERAVIRRALLDLAG